jgi:hypothetical protein
MIAAILALAPAGTGLLNLALAVLLALGLQILGAAIGGARRRAEADMLVGWGAASLLVSLIGALTNLSFILMDCVLLALVLIALLWSRAARIPLALGEWGRLVLLSLPLLLVVCPMQPSQWDELSHWLPNARYLLDIQHFPGAGRPASVSVHAGYPYAMPLAVYWVAMADRVIGIKNWAMGTAPVFNVMLLIAAARLLVGLLRRSDQRIASWALLATGLATVTFLCPGFVPKLVLTAYAETGTSVGLFAAAIFLWDKRVWTEPGRLIQLSLILCLVILLKEDNAVALACLLGAALLWTWREDGRFWPTLRTLIIVCVPMVIAGVLWHLYSGVNIPGGEMAARPPSAWRFDLAHDIAAGFLKTALDKSGYFAPMIVIAIFGLIRWLSPRQDEDGLARLAFLTGASFVGYNLFLAFAYATVFPPGEGERVASLWRYNTHLDLLEIAVIALLIRRFVSESRWVHNVGPAVIVIVLIVPLATSGLLRFDRAPYVTKMRDAARDLGRVLPSRANLVMIDMRREGDGCVLAGFELGPMRRISRCVGMGDESLDLAPILADADYLWINGWTAQAGKATGLDIDSGHAHLLARRDTVWNAIESGDLVPAKK